MTEIQEMEAYELRLEELLFQSWNTITEAPVEEQFQCFKDFCIDLMNKMEEQGDLI